MNYYRKPAIITFALMIVAIMMVITFCHGYNHSRSHLYTMTGYVVDITDDCIAIENTAGEIYEWETHESWVIGDIIAMSMDDMGTIDMTDDVILDMTLALAAD